MKRPTIAEIAARAGVSIGAVSYVLNGRPGVSAATRKRIAELEAELAIHRRAAELLGEATAPKGGSKPSA